jgi:energy-coupling factor transport system permease protein
MRIDIRTKLLIAAIFSLLALVYQQVSVLAWLLLLNILVLVLFRVPLQLGGGLKTLLMMYGTLTFMQSFFVRSGEPLLAVGGVYLITADGLYYGISVILRFSILLMSGLLLMSCPVSELLVALAKMKLPYEIIFMVLLGIRFMPMLAGEIQATLNHVQLRGVNLRAVYKKKVIRVYLSIFLPLVYSIWRKAEKLTILLELRGFRRYETRENYREFAMGRVDYLIMGVSIGLAVLFVCLIKV